MKSFLHVQDLGPLDKALAEAAEIKKNRYMHENLGHHKTALLIFFNNSLRTRLSTQKAARNLGLDVVVLDVNQGAWKLETEMPTMQRTFSRNSSNTVAALYSLWKAPQLTPCRLLPTSSR